jgi:hypothetical protein
MSTRAKVGAVFVLASTSFFTVSLRATSVVALIDKANHTLVIAADCCVTRDSAWGSECKIINEPGCIVAIAGHYEERTTAFNLRQLARRGLPIPWRPARESGSVFATF